jgi:prophage regulatory protein
MSSAKATWPPEDSHTEGTYASVRHRRLLRLGEVLYRTGMSRSSAYVYMAKGQFPQPVKLGRTSAWPEDEIEAWITAKIAQRDRLMRLSSQR